MEAFVYSWVNRETGRQYIGYHKGSDDDGYVSSSKSDLFWKDYQKGKLKRKILFRGTVEECVERESELIRSKGIEYLYNRNINGRIIMTEDVRNKVSRSLTGRKQSEEHIANRSEALKGREGGFKGKSHDKTTLQKISESAKNRKRKTCPHCGTSCAVNTYSRWHGDNANGRSRSRRGQFQRR